jgi:hypothetical protein
MLTYHGTGMIKVRFVGRAERLVASCVACTFSLHIACGSRQYHVQFLLVVDRAERAGMRSRCARHVSVIARRRKLHVQHRQQNNIRQLLGRHTNNISLTDKPAHMISVVNN